MNPNRRRKRDRFSTIINLHSEFGANIAYPCATSDGQRKITISIGVSADVARNDQVLAALMGRADEALYVAKRNGRDRTEVWHGGMRAFDGTPAHRKSMEVKTLGVPE